MVIVLLSVPALIAAFIYKKNTKLNSNVKFFYLWIVSLFIINLLLLLIMNHNLFLANIKNSFSYIYEMVKTMDLTRDAVLSVIDEAYNMLFVFIEVLAFLYVAGLVISILLPICVVIVENFILKVKLEMKDESQGKSSVNSDQGFLD